MTQSELSPRPERPFPEAAPLLGVTGLGGTVRHSRETRGGSRLPRAKPPAPPRPQPARPRPSPRLGLSTGSRVLNHAVATSGPCCDSGSVVVTRPCSFNLPPPQARTFQLGPRPWGSRTERPPPAAAWPPGRFPLHLRCTWAFLISWTKFCLLLVPCGTAAHRHLWAISFSSHARGSLSLRSL